MRRDDRISAPWSLKCKPDQLREAPAEAGAGRIAAQSRQEISGSSPEWSYMRELPGIFVRSVQKRLNFALLAARHDTNGKGLAAPFCRRLSCNQLRRELLVNLDVIEITKPILQVRQASLKARQTLLRCVASEQVSKKIACIAELLDCDPQLMALLAIKLSNLFRLLYRLLSTPRDNIRGEPFDRPMFIMSLALCPISSFEPLQREL